MQRVTNESNSKRSVIENGMNLEIYGRPVFISGHKMVEEVKEKDNSVAIVIKILLKNLILR